jgi:hypothetical protein
VEPFEGFEHRGYAFVFGFTVSKRSPAWTRRSGFFLMIASTAARKLS